MVLSTGNKQVLKTGSYFEPGVTDMLALKMLKGTHAGLKDPASILLSATAAGALFGDADPIGKYLKIDNQADVMVTGVYEDIARESEFGELSFISSWQLYVNQNNWIRKDDWEQNGFRTYVQLANHVSMEQVSAKIAALKLNNVRQEELHYKPSVFLFPMDRWHLYNNFENGVNTGGHIKFVWLYGIIGLFVLLLACINFMNLATARSEKRAKEVGIRKAIGSFRRQLISQFIVESLVVVTFAYVVALLLIQLSLPFFNQLADKQMHIPWTSPFYWLLGMVFCLFTGLVAGSYPALYLSAFQPVKVLKGTFRVGRLGLLPRQVLVVLQFTVSIVLMIGVLIVYRQIQIGRDRPVGYTQEGLVMVYTPTASIHTHIGALRDELKQSGAVVELAESLNPLTNVSFTSTGFDWKGTGPDQDAVFGVVWVAHEFGKTVGWQFREGRDFSTAYASDSTGMVLNEAAVKLMALQDPIGTTIKQTDWLGKEVSYKVIGVIRDMLMESPYVSVRPSVYFIGADKGNYVNIRINPTVSSVIALDKIAAAFKKYSPESPFEYQFVSDVYGQKFREEERIGKLAGCFTVLAIFISCLGIFGMAAFMVVQRTKEIGVRKVLGASVWSLWRLLSSYFLKLVMVALCIATPIAYYCMNHWLQDYQIRTGISGWIFVVVGACVMMITLLTISFQTIKAAGANPVKSLQTE
jgi:putative ABC transport system permease protein